MLRDLFSSVTSPTFGFLLKLLAGLAAAAFGIVAIGVTTRDEKGRLNRNGWTALVGICVAGTLALGTSVYDFASGQQKDREERARSERLIVSIQRGVYPLRGANASFDISLPKTLGFIKTYEKGLRRNILGDRYCRKPHAPFSCYGVLVGKGGGPFLYRVPMTSSLFPKSGSALRYLIQNLYVHVSLYHLASSERADTEAKADKYLGRFFAKWQKLPKDTWLAYNFTDNTLSLGTERLPLSNESLASSGVYSIIDIFPGLIATTLTVSDDNLCEELRAGNARCLAVLNAVAKESHLNGFALAFSYPKKLAINDGSAARCLDHEGDSLILRLPADIESIDSLGNIDGFRESAQARNCALAKAMLP